MPVILIHLRTAEGGVPVLNQGPLSVCRHSENINLVQEFGTGYSTARREAEIEYVPTTHANDFLTENIFKNTI